jgi:uncharacterized membrane protein YgdD (TMEM256/DUF423 family)
MKTRAALSILFAFLLVACGGTGAPGSTAKTQPGTTQKPGTAVDCTKLKAAVAQLIGLQFLAQLTTPDNIASIKSIGNLDLDAMLSALGDLHALDSVSTPLGNAKASIDAYEKAAKAAKVLIAMNPVTQAAIDAYNKDNVGTVADFLGKQVAISGAMGEAGC